MSIYIPGAYRAPILDQGHVPLSSTPPCMKTRPCHKNTIPLILVFFVGVWWSTHIAKIFPLLPLSTDICSHNHTQPIPTAHVTSLAGQKRCQQSAGLSGGSGDSGGFKSFQIQSVFFLPRRSSSIKSNYIPLSSLSEAIRAYMLAMRARSQTLLCKRDPAWTLRLILAGLPM